jgi:hypothetical protein
MKLSRVVSLFPVLTLAVVLSGCSGGSSKVVSAQTSYSNASITGTYSVLMSAEGQGSGTGSLIADGNGNITSGSILFFVSDNPGSCNIAFSGTYNLLSNANGIMSLNPTITNLSGTTCSQDFPLPWKFNIQAGASGDSLLFVTSTVPSNGGQILSGSAIKQ